MMMRGTSISIKDILGRGREARELVHELTLTYYVNMMT
jgi:hypothetical protein